MLQELVYEHGITEVDMQAPTLKFKSAYTTPFIRSWPERCILCLRCVTACQEIQCHGALDVIEDGPNGKLISFDRDKCVSCGECIQVCPVGALLEKKASLRWRPWEVKKIRTTCPYCGVGVPAMASCQGRQSRQGIRCGRWRTQQGAIMC